MVSTSSGVTRMLETYSFPETSVTFTSITAPGSRTLPATCRKKGSAFGCCY